MDEDGPEDENEDLHYEDEAACKELLEFLQRS